MERDIEALHAALAARDDGFLDPDHVTLLDQLGDVRRVEHHLDRRDPDDAGPYGYGYGAASLTNVWDIMYMVDMTIGDQMMPLEIDTGSSDTWVVGKDFACVDKDMKPWPVSYLA